MFEGSLLLTWLATYWLHSTLLLGGTWIWFRYHRPSSHTLSESAWKLASVGAFVTASLQLGLSIESPLNTALKSAWWQPGAARLASAMSGESGSQATSTGNVSDLIVRTAGLSMPSWALKCQGLFLSVVPSVLFILGLALLAFTLLGVVRLIVSQLGFLQRMQSCQTVESGDARDILDRLLKTSGIRRKVTLLLIADEIEPGAWGLLSWRIVLPPRALDDLSKTELQALLAHELAHLARGDQWWIWIGHVLTLCIGWQPLNRIAFREWRKSAEYLCDAWAVECNVSRLNLARCLASVAGWRMSTVVRLAGVTGENRSSLSGRVERLIDDCALSDPWRTPGRRQILAAASGFLGVVVVCCAPSAKLFGSPSVAVKQMDVAVANSKSESTREDLPESVEPTAVSSRRRGNSRLASLQENDYPQMAFMPSWQPDRGADEHVERPQAAAPTVNKSPRRKLTRVIFHEVSIQDVLVDLDTLALDLMDLEEMLVQSRTLINSRQAQFKVTHFHVRLLGYVQSREASDQLEL